MANRHKANHAALLGLEQWTVREWPSFSRAVAKPSVAIRMTHAWKHLHFTFALIRPEAITDELCLRYYNERRGAGAAIETINNELTYLRASLKFAFRNRWIDAEPRVLVPRRPPTTTNRLTIFQMRRLLAAASMPHLRLFIALTNPVAPKGFARPQMGRCRPQAVIHETSRLLRPHHHEKTQPGCKSGWFAPMISANQTL